MFLTSPNLVATSHGFFTRNGGASGGIYSSLNCGHGSNDNKEQVAENRRRVAEKLGTVPAQLCSLHQTHSADCIVVTKPWDMPLPRADAMVTTMPGIALGILTADCGPVLFADMEASVIGAAHSGWRGAFAGILEATVQSMVKLGAKTERIAAALGPCIAAPSYEVSAPLHDKFIHHCADYARYFSTARRPDHFFFDLKAFVHGRLAAAGLSNIIVLENDTYVEEDAFFSFRRATHRGDADYGRQISAIMLR